MSDVTPASHEAGVTARSRPGMLVRRRGQGHRRQTRHRGQRRQRRQRRHRRHRRCGRCGRRGRGRRGRGGGRGAGRRRRPGADPADEEVLVSSAAAALRGHRQRAGRTYLCQQHASARDAGHPRAGEAEHAVAARGGGVDEPLPNLLGAGVARDEQVHRLATRGPHAHCLRAWRVVFAGGEQARERQDRQKRQDRSPGTLSARACTHGSQVEVRIAHGRKQKSCARS